MREIDATRLIARGETVPWLDLPTSDAALAGRDQWVGDVARSKHFSCGAAAVAADGRLAGFPVVASRMRLGRDGVALNSRLYRLGVPATVRDLDELEQRLRDGGHGARTIAMARVRGQGFPHAFNVVNDRGDVVYIDAWLGRVMTRAEFVAWWQPQDGIRMTRTWPLGEPELRARRAYELNEARGLAPTVERVPVTARTMERTPRDIAADAWTRLRRAASVLVHGPG